MFLENKYTRWYYQIVENAKNRELDGYGEKHHIIPKSLGGCNEKENLVKLTAREHLIVHMFLTKMVKGESRYKMLWALHRMVFTHSYPLTSRQYEMFRRIHAEFISECHRLGISYDESWRLEMSNRVQDDWDNNPERKKKMSEWAKEYAKKRMESDPEGYLERLREIGLKGAIASAKVNGKKVEYKGKTYQSWPDLLEKTGVSKYLYKKYYMNGIDPEPRIGTDGPVGVQVEYKGKYYNGWQELQRETGVAKYSYETWYLNGYDPEVICSKHGRPSKKLKEQARMYK